MGGRRPRHGPNVVPTRVPLRAPWRLQARDSEYTVPSNARTCTPLDALEMRYTGSTGIEGSNPSRSGFPYGIRTIGAGRKRHWIWPNAAFAPQTRCRPNDFATPYDCGARPRRPGSGRFRAPATEATATAGTAKQARGANGEGGVRHAVNKWDIRITGVV